MYAIYLGQGEFLVADTETDHSESWWTGDERQASQFETERRAIAELTFRRAKELWPNACVVPAKGGA